MGVHEREARTKTDRLIATVETLTEELRRERSRKVYAVIVQDYEDVIYCAGVFSSKEAAETECAKHGAAHVSDHFIDDEIDEPKIAVAGVAMDQLIRSAIIDDAYRHGPISATTKS